MALPMTQPPSTDFGERVKELEIHRQHDRATIDSLTERLHRVEQQALSPHSGRPTTSEPSIPLKVVAGLGLAVLYVTLAALGRGDLAAKVGAISGAIR